MAILSPVLTTLMMCFLCTGVSYTQTNVIHSIIFNPTFGNSRLVPNESYYKINNSDSIQIQTLKMYISKIQFLENNTVVYEEENSFHLIDVNDEKSLVIDCSVLSAVKFNQISFAIGIDSNTNVSGAMGGVLDPTRGMYWTWQSGYINFKLEGKSNLCRTRNNEFQFHIGGYLLPFTTLQTVTLNANQNRQITIDIDLKKLIDDVDLAKLNHIMSPSKEAALFSEKTMKIFSVH